MQDMINKDFDKLILKYGLSKVQEYIRSVFNTAVPNADNTIIGDRLIADQEVKSALLKTSYTSDLVNKIQYKGVTITLGNFNNDTRMSFNSPYDYTTIPIIKINIVIQGVIKLMPTTEFYLQYSEDLNPSTVIGDVYKNAFDYAKSIIDGGYAG